MLLFGDVEQKAAGECIAGGVFDDRAAVAHPHVVAVTMEHPVVALECLPRAVALVHLFHHALAVVGVHEIGEHLRARGPLLGRPAEELMDLGARVDVCRVVVDEIDVRDEWQRFDEAAEAAFGFVALALDALSLADVVVQREEPRRRTPIRTGR